MIVETEGGVCWIAPEVQTPNRKFPERPVHWTWLHGPTAPTTEQLEHGRRAAQTRRLSFEQSTELIEERYSRAIDLLGEHP